MPRNSIAIDGRKVRELRVRLGMSQADLVRKSGISARTIESIEESGQGEEPRGRSVYANTLRELAGALGVTPDELRLRDDTGLRRAAADHQDKQSAGDPPRETPGREAPGRETNAPEGPRPEGRRAASGRLRMPHFDYAQYAPPSRFVNREELLREAGEMIQAGQSFLLVGSPRSGKTSFCHKLIETMHAQSSQKILATYLSLQFYRNLTVETFLEHTVLNVAGYIASDVFDCKYTDFELTNMPENLKRRMTEDRSLAAFYHVFRGLRERTYDRDGRRPPPLTQHEFAHFMGDLLAIIREKQFAHCVLVHDEANHLEERFSIDLLTSNWGRLMSVNVSNVFAASPEMAGALTQLKQSFGICMELQPFAKKEYLIDLLTRYYFTSSSTAGDERLPITDGALDSLWNLSGQRPYQIQYLASRSFRNARNEAAELVTEEHVRDAYAEARQSQPEYFM
jgi:transcriptional regulator with XRE-family HTH domain